MASLVFCSCTKESLLDFNDISNDCVEPLRVLRFLFILVLGAATGCCFFVLGAGIDLYGGIGLASKYCINCRTFILGVGTGVLLLGARRGSRSTPYSSGSRDKACFFPYIKKILEFTH